MLFRYKKHCLVNYKNYQKEIDILINFQTKLKKCALKNKYNCYESSARLPFDKILFQKSHILTKKYAFAKNIILIGIGGSNLGTKAVWNFLKTTTTKKIIYLDTINENKLNNLVLNKLKYTDKNTCVIVIGKSGKTTETIVNFEIVLKILPHLKKNTVIISDKKGLFTKQAESKNFDVLIIPKKVGGRFSVLSPVGIFALTLLNFNTKHLVKGARQAVKDFYNNQNLSNCSLLALITYLNYLNNKSIVNYFIFNEKLSILGKWLIQLTAESLGKNGVEILPILSVGTTDLHSIYQAYINGNKNIFTIFIDINVKGKLKLDKKLEFKNLVDNINNKKIEDIKFAIYKGVKNSYIKNKLPFVEIEFSKNNEYELGYFMQFFMLQTMCLAKLLNVNAYNQPGVEEYKKETRRILKEIE